MLKIVVVLGGLLLLLFLVTWQNVQLYELKMQIQERSKFLNSLEKELYLKRIELADLESRERVGATAREAGMEQITYRDVKIVVY
jgi:cell division protein FtsL